MVELDWEVYFGSFEKGCHNYIRSLARSLLKYLRSSDSTSVWYFLSVLDYQVEYFAYYAHIPVEKSKTAYPVCSRRKDLC